MKRVKEGILIETTGYVITQKAQNLAFAVTSLILLTGLLVDGTDYTTGYAWVECPENQVQVCDNPFHTDTETGDALRDQPTLAPGELLGEPPSTYARLTPLIILLTLITTAWYNHRIQPQKYRPTKENTIDL